MDERVEALLNSPYWVVDILPEQVPRDSPGQYFAVESYYLEADRLADIKQRHVNVMLKLNCYRQISIAGEGAANPAPEHLAEEMCKRSLLIMVDGSLIQSEPDSTNLTVFSPDEGLLDLIRTLAAGEGLFVWKPPLGPEPVEAS